MSNAKPLAIEVVLALLAGLLGGLLAPLLTDRLHRENEINELQLDTFKRIAGYRFKLTPQNLACNADEYYSALNEAAVVFHDAPTVRAALNQYRLNVDDDNANEYLLAVLKAMMTDLEIAPVIEDAELLRPFTSSATRCSEKAFRGCRKKNPAEAGLQCPRTLGRFSRSTPRSPADLRGRVLCGRRCSHSRRHCVGLLNTPSMDVPPSR